MISRWCAAPGPEVWVSLGDGSDGDGDETFTVDQHDRCRSERWHDRNHYDCCASDIEKESWDCTCACHAGSPGRRMT
jgi:hypothetical protein